MGKYYRYLDEIYFDLYGDWFRLTTTEAGFVRVPDINKVLQNDNCYSAILNKEERHKVSVAIGTYLFKLPDDVIREPIVERLDPWE